MKKVVLILILAVLIVSLLVMAGFVYAVQGQGNQNKTQEQNKYSYSCNVDSDCKVEHCGCDDFCGNLSHETLVCILGCDVNKNYKSIQSCGCKNNKCEEVKTKRNITFVPWQKRNESECLEGCKCVGAVMSCPTETGKIMTIQAGRSGNIITITIVKNGNKTEVNTTLEIETENETKAGKNKTRLRVKLSDGSKREIKIMPDTASERALERLRLKVCSAENNCTIILKDTGERNETGLMYEMNVRKKTRVLGLFGKRVWIKAWVNAETGEIIIKKPWWAVLAEE